MKILVLEGCTWDITMPSNIDTTRITRAMNEVGHEVIGIDVVNEEHGWDYGCFHLPDNWKDGFITNKETEVRKKYHKRWGVCHHVKSSSSVKSVAQNIIKEEEPDIVFGFADGVIREVASYAKQMGAKVGVFLPDVYYQGLPHPSIGETYNMFYDFVASNEGMNIEYLKTVGVDEERLFLMLHAFDPSLAPSTKEIENAHKDYIISFVGCDSTNRRMALIEYFYEPTLSYPNKRFLVAGMPVGYTEERLKQLDNHGDPSVPIGKITRWARDYNLTCLENTNIHGIYHDEVHGVYKNSFYGFHPFGDYLTTGFLSQYVRYTYKTGPFERMGGGSALLANNITDLDLLIKDGKTGFILNSQQDTIDAIQYAIDNPEEVKQMGLNARKLMLDKHTYVHRVNDLIKFVEGL